MRFFLCLTQTVTGTTNDNVHLVVHPVTHKRIQGQARHAITIAIFAEKFSCSWVCLYRLFSTTFGESITLEHNHQTLTGTTRSLIAQIRNAGDLTV